MEQPKSSYIGHHAELYDLFYADKPYIQEAGFVDGCIRKYGLQKKTPRILELACGTGNHAFALEKLGYRILATDYSADMLAEARIKALRMKSEVEFREQDMRTLDVRERPFDAVICLFDSLGYVAANENIGGVLRNVHSHLSEGGLFIFEFWHAGAMLCGYDPLRLRRWKTENGEILRLSETTIDLQKQLCHVSYSIYELFDDGNYHYLRETQTNRFFLLQEMAYFLSEAGLSPLKWFAGYQEDEKIDDETWHIVAVASRLRESVI